MGNRRRGDEVVPKRRKKTMEEENDNMDDEIDECQKASSEICRIEQLPEDILLYILSFFPTIAEKSRTAVLSRRWRYLWHNNVKCLDFDATTRLLPGEHHWKRLYESHDWYLSSISRVFEARVALPELTLVKDLRFRYKLEKKHRRTIDQWINFAIANRVEALSLDFGMVYSKQQYRLSEKFWYRAPSGLSSIRCLKSLFLSCVNVSKRFIEFVLSSCPLLEELSLHNCGTYKDLDVSGVPPLRLRLIEIDADEDFALAKLCAPYLTSFSYRGNKFNPRYIDVPMLTDLTIGSLRDSQPIVKYLEPFQTYLPQLERLELLMEELEVFELEQRPIPKLVNLKYLMINFNSDTDPIFDQIINLIDACPLLETFALQIIDGEMIPDLTLPRRGREQKWLELEKRCSFKCLKVLELYSGDGKTIDQDVVKFTISNAPHLEKLTYDLQLKCRFSGPHWSFSYDPKIVKGVEEKAKKLCKLHRNEINIKVIA